MKKLISIIVLSLISIWNAIYLTIAALKFKAWIWEKLVCDINSTLSCSDLFSFDFTWIFWKIPFPMLAIFVYIFIIILALTWVFKKYFWVFKIIMIIWICWMLFNFYIIFNEFKVWVFCLWCLVCSIVIIAITIISLMWFLDEKNKIKNLGNNDKINE